MIYMNLWKQKMRSYVTIYIKNIVPCSNNILKYILNVCLNMNVIIYTEEHTTYKYVAMMIKTKLLNYDGSLVNIKFIEDYIGSKVLDYYPSCETIKYIRDSSIIGVEDLNPPEYTYRYCENVFRFYSILTDNMTVKYRDRWLNCAIESNHIKL